VGEGGGRTWSDARGFQYAEYDLGPVAADASFDFKVSYGKNDATPSVPRVTMAPGLVTVPTLVVPQPLAGGSPSTTTWLALALGAAGVALIGSALLVRTRRPAPAAKAPKGTKRAAPAASFCTGCGARLAPGARFCSQFVQPMASSPPTRMW
jgi:hypothetical protein